MAHKVSSPPGLHLHPRTLSVSQAGAEFNDWLIRFWEAKELTTIELLGILNDAQLRVVTHALRAERHPFDPDKKADEA
jgi:hypothetical protein